MFAKAYIFELTFLESFQYCVSNNISVGYDTI